MYDIEMMVKVTWIYAVFLVLLTNFKIHGYNKTYTLYQVTAFTRAERNLLLFMENLFKYVHILNGVTNEAALPTHIAVDNCCTDIFVEFLQEFSISFVKTSEHYNDYRTLKPSIFSIHGQFIEWNYVQYWFQSMEKKYPQLLTKIVIGLTYEKREILAFKVSTAKNKPAIIILGGEEGRDWMSSAIVLNLMESVLATNKHMLPFDYYFLPLLNPDGYEFSRTKERFWTKNRKKCNPIIPCPDNNIAIGANIDRNWFEGTGGLSDCGAIYKGTKPLSEEETLSLALFLDTIAPQILAFFNIRGFDNIITTPYATNKKRAFNYDTTMEIINFACKHVKRKFNVSYTHGSTSSLFFNRSGNCADWVKENLNVPMVATIYSKNSSEVLPQPKHIRPQYLVVHTILTDILHLTRDLYGPLFNSQTNQSSYIVCVLTMAMYIFI